MKSKHVFNLILILCLTGCTEVQKSAGMALDSAGSVVDSGSKKLWTTPAKTAGTTDIDTNPEKDEEAQ